ncbi:hypothetical protein RAC66_10070 [Pseudomonas sp. LR_1]
MRMKAKGMGAGSEKSTSPGRIFTPSIGLTGWPVAGPHAEGRSALPTAVLPTKTLGEPETITEPATL